LHLKEKNLLQEILWTIKEIDSRRMYLDFGYASLFLYLTQGVGYSEGSAQRRIDGARLLKELPEISSMIQSGEIKLSQVAMVQKASRQVFKNHNKNIILRDLKPENIIFDNKGYCRVTDLGIARYWRTENSH
jgi:hypothetical protein